MMKKLNPEIDMLKKERREMFAKLTRFARKKIAYMVDVDGYTRTEIARIIGVENPRITEILGFEKGYQLAMSEPLFRKLILGGIVSVKEIKKHLQLTEKEKNYLDKYKMLENKALINELLDLYLEQGEEGVLEAVRQQRQKKN